MPSPTTPPRLQLHDHLVRVLILPLVPRAVQPNHLTLARFAVTPVVWWGIGTQQYAWAVPLFALAVLSDIVDGSLARVRDAITRWGETFDPVADKLLMGGVFVILGLRYFRATTLLIIAIDLSFIAAGAFWQRAGHRIKANVWGKLKMSTQVVAASMLLATALGEFGPGYFAAVHGLLWLSIGFAVASLVTHAI